MHATAPLLWPIRIVLLSHAHWRCRKGTHTFSRARWASGKLRQMTSLNQPVARNSSAAQRYQLAVSIDAQPLPGAITSRGSVADAAAAAAAEAEGEGEGDCCCCCCCCRGPPLPVAAGASVPTAVAAAPPPVAGAAALVSVPTALASSRRVSHTSWASCMCRSRADWVGKSSVDSRQASCSHQYGIMAGSLLRPGSVHWQAGRTRLAGRLGPTQRQGQQLRHRAVAGWLLASLQYRVCTESLHAELRLPTAALMLWQWH
jgi:hypothetical protein